MNNTLESIFRKIPYKALLILVLPLVILEPLYYEAAHAWRSLSLKDSIKDSVGKWKRYWKEDLS